MTLIPLPIDSFIPEIIENLKISNAIILQASPGAGKSTRVPKSLVAVTDKVILVLEPRRLAARLCAERVAMESGEKCGETIGFQVRYAKQESNKTKIKYITEGIFLRLFLSDPMLSNIGCVVIDEFHERHIHTDVTLMLVKQLQQSTRPDLKLVVMSATLEMKDLSNYLPSAKVFMCPGITYPVDVQYLSMIDQNRSLETKVYFAVEEVLSSRGEALSSRGLTAGSTPHTGHILVFLPGAFEIRKSAEILSDLKKKHDIVIYELRADTPFDQQQKIFEPSQQTKIILSTNVAETSITIDKVTAVIDSGLAKIATYAGWSGLSRLEVKPISQASCIQRGGRAGRTQSGIAKRLFSQFDFGSRPKFETPEIQRLDLTQTLLELKNVQTLSAMPILDLPWFDPPSKNNIESACALLQNLDAFDKENDLTEVGKEISKFPLHPRLSRILYEAKKRGVLPQSLFVVSLISEGMIFFRNSEPPDISHSDIKYQLDVLKLILKQEEISYAKKKLVDLSQVKKVEALSRYLCELTRSSFQDCFRDISDENLTVILLSSFSDRVCKKRHDDLLNKKKDFVEVNLCLGGGAFLSKFSMVQDDDVFIAVEAEQTIVSSAKTQIRICHGVTSDLLLKYCPNWISEKQEIFWDSERKIVRSVVQNLYGKMILSEKQNFSFSKEFEGILKKELAASWPKPFDDDLPLQFLKIRKKLAEKEGYSLEIPSFEEEDFEFLLYHISDGKKSFSEILSHTLEHYISDLIDPSQLGILNSLFPTQWTFGKGKKVKIHYEEGKAPFISARLQDFFGMVQTPKICNQKVSLVVQLLAPNMQVIQVTNDLVGFWKRDYPQVKKELSRRYPRHKWPDDPMLPMT
jgi:ATP-dependent helicase HrpB